MNKALEMGRRIARARVLHCLRDYPGATAAFVDYITLLPARRVLDHLNALIREGLVTCRPVHVLDGTREVSAVGYELLPETIGPCEICGGTDHHRVGGLCPTCRARSTTLDAHHDGDVRCVGDIPCEEPEHFDCDIRLAHLAAELGRLRDGQHEALPPAEVLLRWRLR